jgi:predicted RNA binding protein YcfA (HicA-like mRNA interferase family)
MPRIPGVNHLDAVRALEKAGFQIIRQGKHIVMSDGTRQVVSVPTIKHARSWDFTARSELENC